MGTQQLTGAQMRWGVALTRIANGQYPVARLFVVLAHIVGHDIPEDRENLDAWSDDAKTALTAAMVEWMKTVPDRHDAATALLAAYEANFGEIQ